MGKFKIQPREFRLRAGARTELDRNFLQIIANLPAEANLSEFIKTAVVESFQRQNKLTEVEKLQQELEEIQTRLQELRVKIRLLEEKNEEPEELNRLKSLLQSIGQEIITL